MSLFDFEKEVTTSDKTAIYAFVSELPHEYVCQVCTNVLQDPHATECCGQHFCKACLEKWFEKNTEKVCPHCRVIDFNHIHYKPLQRKINELKVFCSNRDKGCTITLNLEDLDSHLLLTNASGCGYVLIPCVNDCGMSVFRGEMDLHLKKCTKREEACPHCKAKMTYDSLDDHYLVCTEKLISCRECGKPLRRHALKDHEATCPHMPVRCPFYDAGCTKELIRHQLDEHIENNSIAHLTKVMASYSLLKADHDSLQADVKLLKQENVAVKKESADFKSQAAVEVARMKKVIDSPTCILKSLECMESLLHSYKLISFGDKISFSIPPEAKEEWQSPSFIISPGYTFLVRFQESARNTCSRYFIMKSLRLALVLLQGEVDDNLEWPMRITDANICISLQNTDFNALNSTVEITQMSVDTNSLDIQRCVLDDSVVVSTKTHDFHDLELLPSLSVSLEYSFPC